jgi:hypothetical protein
MSLRKKALAWFALAIPPLSFFILLAKSLPRIPMGDDYVSLLDFLLRWKNTSGLNHFALILTYQQNEYRCMVRNAIFAAQYSLLGHADVHALSILGDLLILPIFAALYLIWRECGRPQDYRLYAFVPVSWLLFQLQYEGCLNYLTTEFQHLPVTLFVLLTCWVAGKTGRWAYLWALLGLLLCIASDANGLFMTVIGALIYLERKEYKKLAGWCSCSLLAGLFYFHGYNFSGGPAQGNSSNIVISIFQHFSPVFALAFLGDIAAVQNPLPAILFGIVLIGLFLWATWDRLFKRWPALYYSMLFFVITGAAVAGHRSNLGIVTALNPTYRINSLMLVILLYLFLADKFYGVSLRPLTLRAGVVAFATLLIAFDVLSDRGGQKVLLTKRAMAEAAMLRYVRHEPQPVIVASPADDLSAALESKHKTGFGPIEPTFSDSMQAGILILPVLHTNP